MKRGKATAAGPVMLALAPPPQLPEAPQRPQPRAEEQGNLTHNMEAMEAQLQDLTRALQLICARLQGPAPQTAAASQQLGGVMEANLRGGDKGPVVCEAEPRQSNTLPPFIQDMGMVRLVQRDGNCWWRTMALEVLGEESKWKDIKCQVLDCMRPYLGVAAPKRLGERHDDSCDGGLSGSTGRVTQQQ